jgi:predicted secreted protein
VSKISTCALLAGWQFLAPMAIADDSETLFNVVRLQAQAEREIPNDQMTVTLVTEHEGTDTAQLAALINTEMEWALGVAKREPTVSVATRSYQTYPMYNRNMIVGWRASQELELKSENIEVLSRLTGALQQKLQVRQMTFNPTDATRKRVEDALIEEALEAFHARVALVAKHMDQQSHRVVNLDINSGGYQPPMPFARAEMKAMASMDSVAAPAVDVGTSRIVVTISGAVQFF